LFIISSWVVGWLVGWLVGMLVTQSVTLLIEAAGSHTCCMEDTLYSLWWCT